MGGSRSWWVSRIEGVRVCVSCSYTWFMYTIYNGAADAQQRHRFHSRPIGVLEACVRRCVFFVVVLDTLCAGDDVVYLREYRHNQQQPLLLLLSLLPRLPIHV